jgi:cyclopropane fatty-acyl-phospholipid synthase-like methyltransferase
MDKTQQTIASYNRCAEAFTGKYLDLGIYQKFIEDFSKRLKVGALILDLGCGPGNTAKFLMDQDRDYQILGVDLSAEMIKLARRNVPNGSFTLNDLRYFEPDQTFDAIIASFSLIHLDAEEVKRLLAKTFTWLNENGYLYLSFMDGGVPGFEKTDFSQDELFFYYHPAKQIVRILESAGYEIVSRYSREYLRAGKQMINDVFIVARKR